MAAPEKTAALVYLQPFPIISSQPDILDPPIQDICKYLEKVVRMPQVKHETLQRVLRALQRWLESVSNYERIEHGIVPALAKVFDTLLQKDYSRSDVLNSLLDLLFVVEDISEITGGKEACGPYFISRFLALVPTKLASVILRRAAVETLCVLITRCPANQQAILERKADCLLLFNGLLSTCGDFQLQASIAEISYRICRRDPQLINLINVETFRGAIQSLLEIKRPNLLSEIRNLVVLVNNSLGSSRSVYSFLSDWVKIDGHTATVAKEKWFHFGKTHFSFHALSDPASASTEEEHEGVKIIDVLYVDIIDIRKAEANQLEIVVDEQLDTQALVKDHASGDKRMHIQVSFGEEDMDVIARNIMTKILGSKSKEASVSKSSGSIFWKSSQGIMIPLHTSKDDTRTFKRSNSDPPCAAKGVKLTSSPPKAVPEIASEKETVLTEVKTLHPEHPRNVGMETEDNAMCTKNLSPCSQIIEEALASYPNKGVPLQLQCGVGKGATAVSKNGFKVPANKVESLSGVDAQSERNSRGGPALVIAADKTGAREGGTAKEIQSCNIPDVSQRCLSSLRSSRDHLPSNPFKICDEKAANVQTAAGLDEGSGVNMTKDQMKNDSGDTAANGEDEQEKILVGNLHKISEEKTAQQSIVMDHVDRKKESPVLKRDKRRPFVKTIKAYAGAKRSQRPPSEELDEVAVTADGPVAEVRSRLHSKRVRLADGNGTLNQVSEPPDTHLEMNIDPLKETCEGDMIRQAVPLVRPEKVYVRGHKPNVASIRGADCPKERRKERSMKECGTEQDINEKSPELVSATQDKSKRLKLTIASDPIKSDSAMIAKEISVRAPGVHQAVGPILQHLGKHPRGRTLRKTTFASSCKLTKPNQKADPGTRSVYSFSEEVDVQDINRTRGRSNKKAMPGHKGTKIVLKSDIKSPSAELSPRTGDVQAPAKRPRGRPRKVDVAVVSKGTEPDRVYSASPAGVVPDQEPEVEHETGNREMEHSPVAQTGQGAASSHLRSSQENINSNTKENSENTPPNLVRMDAIWKRPSTEGRWMLQKSGINCEDGTTVCPAADANELEQIPKQNETQQVYFKRSAIANEPHVHPFPGPGNVVIEPSIRTTRLATRRNTLTSCNIQRRLNQEFEVDCNSTDSISPSDSARLHVQEKQKKEGIQADMEVLSPLHKSDSSNSSSEGNQPVKEPATMPSKGNKVPSSTKGRECFITSEANLDDPYSFTPSVFDTDNLKSPVIIKAHNLIADSEARVTSQMLRNNKNRSPICTPKQHECSPQAGISKLKNALSKPAQGTGRESDEMLMIRKVTENHKLKCRNKPPEQERDVDVYYSTPASASRRRRNAARLPPKLSSGKKSSELLQTDRAAKKSILEDEDWETDFIKHLQRKRLGLSSSENGDKEELSEQELEAPAPVKTPLPFKEESSDPAKLPKSRDQPCKGFKGPKVKFTTPHASDGDDHMEYATKRTCNDSLESPRRKSRGVINCDSDDADEDQGLSRAVILVEKMLKKFRLKLELQVKEKTKKIMDNALQALESEVDSYNAHVQQDLDEYVHICAKKFENLEAQRQAQDEKGRIWQERIAQDFKQLMQESKDLLSKVKSTEAELKAIAEKQRTGQERLFHQVQESMQQNVQNADSKILALRQLSRTHVQKAKQLHGLRDLLKGWI